MSTQTASGGSRIVTVTPEPTTTTVHLKPRTKKKAVQWTDDVVDNEGMGKKSSKSTPTIDRKSIPPEFGPY